MQISRSESRLSYFLFVVVFLLYVARKKLSCCSLMNGALRFFWFWEVVEMDVGVTFFSKRTFLVFEFVEEFFLRRV